MKIIAHRGLLNGPTDIENCPIQIEKAIQEGFDVEIDLRYEFGKYWLGHDQAEYQILFEQIWNWSDKVTVYLHCKTVYTLQTVSKIGNNKNKILPFFHDVDDCILLPDHTIWVHPKSEEKAYFDAINSIFVIPSLRDATKYSNNCYGVCTDYPLSVRKYLK